MRVYGSRRKSTVKQWDMLASNGMIHIVNRLMDSVAPTVEGRPQVAPQAPNVLTSVMPLHWFHVCAGGDDCVSSGKPDEDHLTLQQV